MNHLEKEIREIEFLIKHLPGRHDQSNHGRRFKVSGDESSKVVAGPKIKIPKEKLYDPYETSKNPPPLDFLEIPTSIKEKLQNKMKLEYEKKAKSRTQKIFESTINGNSFYASKFKEIETKFNSR